MIRIYLDLSIEASGLNSLFLKSLNNSKYLFVVYLIVTLRRAHCLRVIRHWVPAVRVFLG